MGFVFFVSKIAGKYGSLVVLTIHRMKSIRLTIHQGDFVMNEINSRKIFGVTCVPGDQTSRKRKQRKKEPDLAL